VPTASNMSNEPGSMSFRMGILLCNELNWAISKISYDSL